MRKRARPLEEKDVRILRENSASFSEVDACSALGTRFEKDVRWRKKVKRWKKYAVIFEEDCQIFLKRSSLLSPSRFWQRATSVKTSEMEFTSRLEHVLKRMWGDEKKVKHWKKYTEILKEDWQIFLKWSSLLSPNSTIRMWGRISEGDSLPLHSRQTLPVTLAAARGHFDR